MKYRHYKGGIYEVVCEAKLEADPQKGCFDESFLNFTSLCYCLDG